MTPRFSSHVPPAVIRVVIVGAVLGCMFAPHATARAQRVADQVTITFWNQWVNPVQKAPILKIIAAFEKAYPTIHVREVDISNDQKILTAITGGRPPDAATMWDISNLGEWAARGAIQNLDSLVKEQHTDLNALIKPSLTLSSYNGHLYALPIELDDYALFINRDIFRAGGLTRLPRTMTEIAADAVRLTKKDSTGRITQLGFAPPTGDQWLLTTVFPYFNGRWYNAANNTVTPDDAGVLHALNWEKAWVDRIGVQAYANFVHAKTRNPIQDDFLDGHVAMAIDGEWMCKWLRRPAYNLNISHWSVLPPPYADGHTGWKNSTSLTGAVNVIPTGAPHAKEAFQFIQFMAGPQAQLIFNKALGNVPVNKRVNAQLAVGCNTQFNELAQETRAFPWPVLPVANDYNTAVLAAEDAVMRGQDTAQHAMAQVKQRIQAALAAAH